MNKELVDDLKKEIYIDLEQSDLIEISNPLYKQFKLSKDDFKIYDREISSNTLAFIDGGNNEISSAPNISIQIIRVAATLFSTNHKIKTIKKEAYCKTTVKNSIFNTKIYDINKNDFFDINLNIKINNSSITEKQRVPSISSITNIARRIAEIKLAFELLKDLSPGSVIILDGSLSTTTEEEEKEMEKLFCEAEKKNILIIGLVKTSRLFTKEGSDLLSFIQNISPKKLWYYNMETIGHNPLNVSLVKLHEKSKYIFRFEFLKKQMLTIDIRKLLGLIASNSKDSVFLGYPYGLILADKIARVTNEEKEYYKAILHTKLGKDINNLEKHENSINAHSILDSISS